MLYRSLPISQFHLKPDVPIYQQIISFLQGQIESEQLRPHTLLPSSRELSKQLNVNRQTVIEAYERLINTGWLYTVDKKGTFVAERQIKQQFFKQDGHAAFAFKQFRHFKEPIPLPMKRHYTIKFDEGAPDPKLAPVLELAMAYKRSYSMHLRLQKTELMPKYPDHSEILHELDKVVGHYCGVNLNEEHSCFIMGIQNALYLVGQVLITKNDIVIVENPGDPLAWEVFQHCGAKLIPVDVDENGLQVEQLQSILEHSSVKAVYVTPQVQYPTTATLSAERRKKLLELSGQYGFAIIEADYDYEYWYEERTVFPLISQDKQGTVIYLSCLSKIMAPLSWISIVTGPASFIQSLKTLASSLDHQGEVVLETAVIRMMKEGVLNRRIRKSAKAYKAKRDAVEVFFGKYGIPPAAYIVPKGGMAYWLNLPGKPDMQQLHKRLQDHNIYFPQMQHCSFGNKELYGLRFGFASLDISSMETAIRELSLQLKSLQH